jgi:thioredoxin-like negative regulator of GroEL
MRRVPVNAADDVQDAVTAVTGGDFDRVVLDGDGPIAVEFMSYSCAHCGTMAPVLEEAASVLTSRVRIFRVNVATDPDIAQRFGIQGTPTFVMFLDGSEAGRAEGPLPNLSSVVIALTQPFGE